MPTIALIGAGPGLGLAIARQFGHQGFDCALIARNEDHLEDLANTLTAEGIRARPYRADVLDATALAGALQKAANDLGPIEVLTYTPVPAAAYLKSVEETTPAEYSEALRFSLIAPVTAVGTVIDHMQAEGRGTILFVNGASSVRPNPAVAGTSVAFAAESAYARILHDTYGEQGVRVAQLVIPGAIRPGHPTHDPDVLASRLWHLHSGRGPFRVFAEPMDTAS